MTEEDIERIYRISAERIAETSLALKRFAYDDIDWSDRLIGVRGARGVGKTTLLLQKICESGEERDSSLYLSLDSVWLDVREIYLLAEYHVQHGGTRLVLDEVHYVKDWQRIIKNIYDDFRELKVAYTGSSLLRLKARDGDLSRRQVGYELPGLSFREFLKFEGVLSRDPIPLETLLSDHVALAREITRKIKVLPLFERYFKSGYYPFYLEGTAKYEDRIRQVVNQALDSDWPSVEDVTAETIRKARKMLRILAALPPQTPKMNRLYAELDTERQHGLKILYALERAGLLNLLASDFDALDNLSSPEKIYCENTNLMYALTPDADIGTARETFFANQVSSGHALTYPKKGDFMVDDRWLFEVGGKGKGFTQIKDVPESFVVNDGVEVGIRNKIPLWLFGFLY
ncbi:MAG: ATP-binding protein [Kiritimatiellae bacterium]|nr:ATP-binding protein [Kiritimatiellia bacterium]